MVIEKKGRGRKPPTVKNRNVLPAGNLSMGTRGRGIYLNLGIYKIDVNIERDGKRRGRVQGTDEVRGRKSIGPKNLEVLFRFLILSL